VPELSGLVLWRGITEAIVAQALVFGPEVFTLLMGGGPLRAVDLQFFELSLGGVPGGKDAADGVHPAGPGPRLVTPLEKRLQRAICVDMDEVAQPDELAAGQLGRCRTDDRRSSAIVPGRPECRTVGAILLQGHAPGRESLELRQTQAQQLQRCRRRRRDLTVGRQ
jgi:hypothetical protein